MSVQSIPSPSLKTPAQGVLTKLSADQHPLWLTVILHLLPGFIVTVFYILLVPPLLKIGINNLTTLNLLALVVLVPIELAILYYTGKHKNGRFSLQNIVLNREKMPLWQLIVLAFVTLVWIALASKLLTPIFDPLIQNGLFHWVPAWFPLNTNFAGVSRQTVIITLVISLVCTSWIAPVVEEMYFRGFLLPRLSHFGGWAPVINGVLFTLYHFFTPWAFVERVVMIIPMAWLVQKKHNIYISIIAHLIVNSLGIIIALFAAIKG
jgi:membrane protease YdiL (CAAX protease family)